MPGTAMTPDGVGGSCKVGVKLYETDGGDVPSELENITTKEYVWPVKSPLITHAGTVPFPPSVASKVHDLLPGVAVAIIFVKASPPLSALPLISTD